MATPPVRAVSTPKTLSNVDLGAGHSFRFQSGSMGAPEAETMPMPDLGPMDNVFESPEVNDFNRVIARREREAGVGEPLPPPPTRAAQAPPRRADPVLAADLSALPERFSIEIERKGGKWRLTAPGVHSGLWRAGESLPHVIHDALIALSEMVSLDGIQPSSGRKK